MKQLDQANEELQQLFKRFAVLNLKLHLGNIVEHTTEYDDVVDELDDIDEHIFTVKMRIQELETFNTPQIKMTTLNLAMDTVEFHEMS